MPIRSDSIFQNTKPADFAIRIGSTDVTALVVRLELSKPLPDRAVPQLISGEISIVEAINVVGGREQGVYAPALANYSLDPTVNPDLRAYAQPITVFGEGRTIAVLRLEEDLAYDFNTGSASGRLVHLVQPVANQASNAVDNIEAGAVQNVYDLAANRSQGILPVGVYAQRILERAVNGVGASPFSASDLDVSGLPSTLSNTYNQLGQRQTNGFDADQDFAGSVPNIIHGLFFENNSQALEPIPGAEQLRASESYPLSQGSREPRLRLNYAQTIITPENVAIEDPATVVNVNSGGIIIQLNRASSEFPKTIVTARFGDGGAAEETTIDEPVDNRDRTITTYSRRIKERALIEGSSSNSVITRTETKTETFGSQGEPTRKDQVYRLTRHELGKIGSQVPGLQRYQQEDKDTGVTTLTQGLTIVTEWEYDNDGNLERRTISYELGRQYVFDGASGDGKVVAAREEEVYERVLASTVNPEWEYFQTRLIPRGLINSTEEMTLVADPDFRSEGRRVDSIPKPEYRSPTSPITVSIFGSRTRQAQISGASDTRLDLQANYAASSEAIDQLSRTILGMNAQLREVWDIRMAMPSGFDLFGSWDIYHVDNGHEARAIALVGPFLIYENNGGIEQVTYGGTVAQLGKLTERIRPVPTPVQPIRFVEPVAGSPAPAIPLFIDAISMTPVAAELILPYRLRAGGGTPPYTFSATNLPAGLAIVGDQIVGTLTSVQGEVVVTITVTDSVAASASTQVRMEVTGVSIPQALFQILNNSFSIAKAGSFSDLRQPNILISSSIARASSFSLLIPPNILPAFAAAKGSSFSKSESPVSLSFASATGSSFSRSESPVSLSFASATGSSFSERRTAVSTIALPNLQPADRDRVAEVAAIVEPGDPQSVIDALSAFQHWYSAALPGTVARDGANTLISWGDIIGSDNAVPIGGDTTSPTYIEEAIGNHISFNGVSDRLEINSLLGMGGTSARTILLVERAASPSATLGFCLNPYRLPAVTSTGNIFNVTPEIGIRVVGGNTIRTQSISSTNFDLAIHKNPTNAIPLTIDVFLNGTLVNAQSNVNQAINIQGNTTSLGSIYGNFLDRLFADIDFAEILTSNTEVSPENLNLVSRFLNEIGNYNISLQDII